MQVIQKGQIKKRENRAFHIDIAFRMFFLYIPRENNKKFI